MSDVIESLKAPFPWFGGKRRAAHLIWPRLGDVPNYVEPFFGSGAVLLNRPHVPGNEIVNDLDCYVANAWRAIRADPVAVAELCDWPVNEADLHARHRWLHARAEFRRRMENDPDYYDARIAAWWVWGISCWIGDNFCRPARQDSMPNVAGSKGVARKVPYLTTGGQVVARKVPGARGGRINAARSGNTQGESLGVRPSGAAPAEPLEELQRAGRGPDSSLVDVASAVPHDGREGRGPESAVPAIPRQLPAIVGTYKALESHRGEPIGKGVAKVQGEALCEWMASLSDRLRFTKVCCGDWTRVVTKAATFGQGMTAVLLDPPYDAGDSYDDVYGDLSRGVSAKVREWAIENGANPLLRIAMCGYEGEHAMPSDWECVSWKATGGYGNQSENKNRLRERIWFSPACLKPEPTLFDL